MVVKVVHLRPRPRLLLTSAVASWWGRSTSAWGSPLKTPDLMHSHHLSRRGSGSKRGCTTYTHTAPVFPLYRYISTQSFQSWLTQSNLYQKNVDRKQKKRSWFEEIWKVTDIDLIHSKLIYIVQGRVIGIKNNSIQLKCTHTKTAKYFFRKCHTWSWVRYKE